MVKIPKHLTPKERAELGKILAKIKNKIFNEHTANQPHNYKFLHLNNSMYFVMWWDKNDQDFYITKTSESGNLTYSQALENFNKCVADNFTKIILVKIDLSSRLKYKVIKKSKYNIKVKYTPLF